MEKQSYLYLEVMHLILITFSSSEIFHDANDIKKLVDFENTYIPITNKMIENISKKQMFN